MGWFGDQIEYRKKHERELLNGSFDNIARSVTGHKAHTGFGAGVDVSDAVSAMLRHLGVKEKEVPAGITGLRDRLDYLLSSTGILYREVLLTKGWHADAMGAMIASLRRDGAMIALLPSGMGGYEYSDPRTGRKIRVSAREERNISGKALCFYRPLPMRALKVRDLLRYMAGSLTVRDGIGFTAASLAITLTGLLIPKLSRILMGTVVETGSMQLLFAAVSFLLFAATGSMVIGVIRSLLLSRIRTRMSVNMGAAAMMRILSLPASFFRDYSAGELNQYVGYMDSLCDSIADSVFSTAVTGVFSLVYLAQIFSFAPSLVWPSLIVTLLTLAVTMVSAGVQMRISTEMMTNSARERGLVYSLITGIRKIRLSGAENRAFARWSKQYVKSAELVFNPPSAIRLAPVLTAAVSMTGTAVMYWTAVRNGVRAADYYAFNAAYAYISSAFSALASAALSAASVRPVIGLIKPLLAATPETGEGRETLTRLSGSVELSHVTFGYDPGSRPVLNDLSVSIPAGQYVAVVGRSGCGKTTLVRLLLGFEKPGRGAITYDRKDIRQLDLRSLRRQIGTVMQDGKLFSGSIFENIVISAPALKLTDAWEAAEIAGIADDIRDMPMGMNTVLQEGGGNISGGQRQRLMIARAIAPKPRILIFDEATSALDNMTQKQVSEALDKMKCTRIVIAHRLSTIRCCDRILVLDGGKIAEDGTYEELIAGNGIFAELVARQRLDDQA